MFEICKAACVLFACVVLEFALRRMALEEEAALVVHKWLDRQD